MHKKIVFLASSTTLALPLHATENDIVELEPVVISSPLQVKQSESALPVTVLSDDELRMKTGHSIGETLKNELGIPRILSS